MHRAVVPPQLLMASGIGLADHLPEIDLPVVANVASLGVGPRDHPIAVLVWMTHGTNGVHDVVATSEAHWCGLAADADPCRSPSARPVVLFNAEPDDPPNSNPRRATSYRGDGWSFTDAPRTMAAVTTVDRPVVD